MNFSIITTLEKAKLLVVNAVWRLLFGKGLTFAANATITRAV
ncbi:hypothetical protein [Helicobacter enhydrae]|nr:hypothetical protein [Helicobacter enhydrae]